MPLNPDDIRARAEGVGFEVITDGTDFCPREINITTPHWTFSFDSHETFGDTDGSGYRAALDLIKAEERRQACEGCGGTRIKRTIRVEPGWGYTDPIIEDPCPDCKGTGKRP